MPRAVPIGRREKVVAQHPRVAKRNRHSLPMGRIACRSRVTDQRHTVSARMLHPEIVCFERSQRPDALRATQERRQAGRRPREFRKKEFHIAAALQTVIRRRGITEINAEAGLCLGKYRGNRA